MIRSRRAMTSGSSTVPQLRGPIIWADEFDGPSGSLVDPAKWDYELGMVRNNELQYYNAANPANSSLDGNGNLVINILNEAFGGANYTSASLLTLGKFDFLYGYIEARIKTPTGSGVWPAFWLEGNADNWPDHGEVDVMEKINTEIGVHTTIHAGPSHWMRGTYYQTLTRDDNFHLYACRVSPGMIEFFIDNRHVYSVASGDTPNGQTWPFDSYPLFIRLNVAFGGDWPGPPDGTAVFPLQMVVDYVRVFELS